MNFETDKKQTLQVKEKMKMNNMKIKECQNIEDIRCKQEKKEIVINLLKRIQEYINNTKQN